MPSLIPTERNVTPKTVCITLDFEKDYGDRVGEFNILKEKRQLEELCHLFKELDLSVSIFVTTGLLEEFPASSDLLQDLGTDLHCHSHYHNTKNPDSATEIEKSAAVFEAHFGYKAMGYRAPQGVLFEGDIDILKKNHFLFSSSVFPTVRPGKFNNLSMPTQPFSYPNGLIELPLAVIPRIRYTISLSYLKLLGFTVNRKLFSLFGLPDVLIFDSHLHDFVLSERSFYRLTHKMKSLYSINKYRGVSIFKQFVAHLRQEGYEFITVTELYHMLL